MSDAEANRRPIAARGSGWAQRLAAALARSAISPNQISVASVVFAAIGAALLVWWPSAPGLLLCALCIQLRLVCNLLDGMVARKAARPRRWARSTTNFPTASPIRC
jgi:hypothetical protein